METVRALTQGLIDYAGLYPPAGLGMADAVRSYAEYAQGPDANMLGRFIVPAGRIPEFTAAFAQHLPNARGKPWTVAAVLGESLGTEFLGIPKFNYEHRGDSESGKAVIDCIEMRANSPTQVERVHSVIQKEYRVYFETSAEKLDLRILDAIARAGLSAKIRMGGTETRAFPSASSVVAFMKGCMERQIPFKATAGLHHAVCGSYPLTYESNAPKSEMFGFLNVFLGAALLYSGADSSVVEQLLAEKDPGAFTFENSALHWRGATLSVEQIRTAREEFALSFGSCSFTEPVQELKALVAQQAGKQA